MGDDVPFPVDAGVDRSLGSTVTDSLDLLNGVRHLHEPQAAGKQLGLKVRAQTKAHDGDIVLVYDGAELVDLGFRQKLALVHDNHVTGSAFSVQKPLHNVGFRRDHLHLRLQPDSAAKDGGPVPDIRAGLDKPDLQIIFLIIVFGDQRLSRLAGTHGAVLKIKLGHCTTSVRPFIIPKSRPARKPYFMRFSQDRLAVIPSE